MNIAIKTLGCKSNRYESDRLFNELHKSHSVFELNEGASTFKKHNQGNYDIFVVNTCTVTNAADRKSRQAIRSFKTKNPDCKVVVFGCGVNVSPEEYKKMTEIDYLAKNTDDALKYIGNLEPGDQFEKCEYEGTENKFEHGFRRRALLKVQDGCNSYCSYCIIPRARGPEVSFDSEKLVREAQKLETEGFSEIVLTGINIGEWKENDLNFGDLIEKLVLNTEKVRFRISSIEPKNFSQKFYNLFKTDRLCPHMHMSLQSGSDKILKLMRRRYPRSVFKSVCEELKKARPEVAITTDIIVGFPGETNEDFEDTYNFAKEIGFAKIHVFPFSARKKTVAYYMKEKVDEQEKKERCKKLRELSKKLETEFKKAFIDQEYEVLVEKEEENLCLGLTENYLPVSFVNRSKKPLISQIVKVRLKRLNSNLLEAEMV